MTNEQKQAIDIAKKIEIVITGEPANLVYAAFVMILAAARGGQPASVLSNDFDALKQAALDCHASGETRNPTMADRSNLIDIEVKIHHATEKAIFASLDGDKAKAVWIPKSQIEIDEEPWGVTTIAIPEPLAIEKGLV